jgi:Protein of unknown function (DUF3987)
MRVKAPRHPPEAARAACLSVLGGLQPGPLERYLREVFGGRGDDGLLQRFQLAGWPDGAGPWRNVDRWPDAAGPGARGGDLPASLLAVYSTIAWSTSARSTC